MDGRTAHEVIAAMVTGAAFTNTHPGNVVAHDASYALQCLCTRPNSGGASTGSRGAGVPEGVVE